MLSAHSTLLQWESENEEDSVVVLSDVWLDRPETLDRLRTLFAGDDQCHMEWCSMRTVPKQQDAQWLHPFGSSVSWQLPTCV